jgi:hypothetical protein
MCSRLHQQFKACQFTKEDKTKSYFAEGTKDKLQSTKEDESYHGTQ